MNIQVNTDHNINGGIELTQYIESVMNDSLERFAGAITRVEVYVSDLNADKDRGADKKCLIEARLAHVNPVVVNDVAETVHQAIDGALDKLTRSLDSMVGKMIDRTSATSLLQNEPIVEEGNSSDLQ